MGRSVCLLSLHAFFVVTAVVHGFVTDSWSGSGALAVAVNAFGVGAHTVALGWMEGTQ